MGLRITNNVSALRALRNLDKSDHLQVRSIERLTSGLRINRASDDPSGLVVSEQLRAQVGSLKQAVDNSQNAAGLIGTADAALQGVSDLLSDIKDSAVFALNEGASSPEQIAAEQAAVDQAISAINRIANTTRYDGRSLLNGTSAIRFLSSTSTSLNDLNVRQFEFAPTATSATVGVSVTTAATRRVLRTGDIHGGATVSVFRITGARGTADVTFAAGAGTDGTALVPAVNSVASVTGVFATTGSLHSADFYAEEYGSKGLVQVELISGGTTFTVYAPGAAMPLFSAGVDAVATIGGASFTGDGRFFDVQTATMQASFSLAPGTATGALAFKIAESGLNFQLNSQALPTDSIRLGIQSVSSSILGAETIADTIAVKAGAPAGTTQLGFLESLKTGGANDLDSNPGNALKVVDEAINQVAKLRGFLGAIQSQTIEPNVDALNVSIENLTASESSIRDLDFADETAEFTRTQILFQAGTSVLSSANAVPLSVLNLLQ